MGFLIQLVCLSCGIFCLVASARGVFRVCVSVIPLVGCRWPVFVVILGLRVTVRSCNIICY